MYTLENRIKVGAVSYLNTKPLLYGLQKLPISAGMDLMVDYPAKIADQLANGTIDLGLVPVALLPNLPSWHIQSSYCIGAKGKVGSVAILSEVPIDEIEIVLLDYQSRSSVALARILLRNFWNSSAILLDAQTAGFEQLIRGTTSAVVIGDRVFERKHQFAYEYDLADAWLQFTGLPFVFAAWVSKRPLPLGFISDFDAANQLGLDNIEEVIATNVSPYYDLRTYYLTNIQYHLDDEMKRGMEKFLQLLTS